MDTAAPPDLPYRAELLRKALHLGALLVPAGILVLGVDARLPLLGLAALAVAGDIARAVAPGPRRWLHAVFGPLMRPEETPPLGEGLVLNGATWMVIAAAACSALFPPAVAAAALTIQMLGDAAAAVIGRRFGAHRWPGSAKSIEGSLAFVGAALAGGLAVAAWPGASLAPGALVTGALVGAAAEALPLGVNDNLRVPLLAAVALLLAG